MAEANSIGKSELETTGKVGFFWFVHREETKFIYDAVVLDDGIEYGDFKTHDLGHYEFWEGLRSEGAPALKARGYPAWLHQYEYEEFPRGRVVYNMPNDLFIVYIDQKLNKRHFINQIVEKFQIKMRIYSIEFDFHYQSTRNIG